jgi:hypothetical protein
MKLRSKNGWCVSFIGSGDFRSSGCRGQSRAIISSLRCQLIQNPTIFWRLRLAAYRQSSGPATDLPTLHHRVRWTGFIVNSWWPARGKLEFAAAKHGLVAFFLPLHRTLTRLTLRWPGIITLAIPSPCTALPHVPPPILHLAPPCAHLLRHRIHALCTHRRRSHSALAPPSRHTSAAGDGAAAPSELGARSALAKAALGRRGRTDRLAADVLHRQRRREAQGEELGGAHEPRHALRRALDPHDLCHARGVAFSGRACARSAASPRRTRSGVRAWVAVGRACAWSIGWALRVSDRRRD